MRQNFFASPMPPRTHVHFRMQNQPRTTIDILPGQIPPYPYMMQFYANQLEASGKNNFFAYNMAELPQAPTIPLNRKRSEVRRVSNLPERKNSVGKKGKKRPKKRPPRGVNVKDINCSADIVTKYFIRKPRSAQSITITSSITNAQIATCACNTWLE